MNLFVVWQVYIQLKSDNHNHMYTIQRSGGWHEKMGASWHCWAILWVKSEWENSSCCDLGTNVTRRDESGSVRFSLGIWKNILVPIILQFYKLHSYKLYHEKGEVLLDASLHFPKGTGELKEWFDKYYVNLVVFTLSRSQPNWTPMGEFSSMTTASITL